jgi:hypothetical protein
VREAAASAGFDPVATMYSAFLLKRCVALRAMMEIRAPFPDQANGLQCTDSSTGLKVPVRPVRHELGGQPSQPLWQVLPQSALQAAAGTR